MSESLLAGFQKDKENLQKVFRQIIDQNIAPCEAQGKEYTKESVQQLSDDLDKAEFTISVCGQINAGKSTFLNYLLFKDKDVLPADDTPWTAKLSTIRYGEKDQATVTYYSEEEWNQLKELKYIDEDTKEEISFYEKFLVEDVDEAAMEGIHPEELIHKVSKKQKNIPLDQLKNYVTKGGYYTPFVHSVDIQVNNEIAKGVVFVDTPGLNDRNVLRSKVTEDWICRSSAVIYLFYTGQPLSRPDYDFIDQHLQSVPSEKLLFVLTKADTSEDYDSALAYVENSLKTDPELAKRKLISDDRKVYAVSTLAAILKYKEEQGIELSDDEYYHKERMEEEDLEEFIDEAGYFPKFVSAIQEHIMSDKGKFIINKGQNEAKQILKTKELALQGKCDELQSVINDLGKTDEELIAKLDEIKTLIIENENISNEFGDKKFDLLGTFENDLSELTNTFKQKIIEKSYNEINSLSSVKEKITLTGFHVKSVIEASIYTLNNNIQQLNINNKVDNLQQEISSKIRQMLEGNDLSNRLSVFMPPVVPLKQVLDGLNLEKLDSSTLKSTARTREWYGAINETQTMAKIKTEIARSVEACTNKISTKVYDSIEQRINKYFEQMDRNLDNELKKSQEQVNNILNQDTNQKILVNQHKEELTHKLQELNSFQEIKKQISNQI
ncbi:dynamin family protein [Flammeovirga yaeyamensis]|uniref:Dynamin family protein n=1 Tax=Flammeovirga yaeyamensis TaxID=367791 RepID=A0AAX1N2G5_9BACT|nr:dynamin family protein [Flammeovirga yaeyamensis]MBB3701203.1 uncharacterized membrane-anchored protein YjiN (DUF445 family) [Flammeovirga yaeyamensis]NMF38471.1 hypothetical protein [Flammeovirga yaeyamensis]QWG01669.1 dynamin family protein [Flammeovirga yaeyamensis]